MYRLVGTLLYASGLRLLECLTLRVKDLEGGKDRVTVIPATMAGPLRDHLDRVRRLHLRDLSVGAGRVALPDALARKYPRASAEWSWQWVFPANRTYLDKQTGERRRHHLHPSAVQRAMAAAVRRTGLVCDSLLEAGYDIRTVHEPLGHRDVSATMIYTHVLNRGGLVVRSPADLLDGGGLAGVTS